MSTPILSQIFLPIFSHQKSSAPALPLPIFYIHTTYLTAPFPPSLPPNRESPATASNPAAAGEWVAEAADEWVTNCEARSHLVEWRGKSGGKIRPQSLILAVMEEKCFSTFP